MLRTYLTSFILPFFHFVNDFRSEVETKCLPVRKKYQTDYFIGFSFKVYLPSGSAPYDVLELNLLVHAINHIRGIILI